MLRIALVTLMLLSLFAGGAAEAADVQPAYIGKHQVTAQDTKLINKVIDDFQIAIKTKDRNLLTSLVVNPNILFESPMKPEDITTYRAKRDPAFDGLKSGGYQRFASFISEAPETLEEKFYNVKITQDGNVAWVMFDYEFVVAGKSENYGIETWQMIKLPGDQWKIASVMWTTNRLPK
jgi:hypothetical protein